MIKQILLLLAILVSMIGFAQKNENQIFIGAFYADKSTISKVQKNKDLPSILKSPNQIEIRLLVREAWSSRRYIVLSFEKNWKIAEYIYSHRDSTYILKSERTDKTLEITFQNLVKNNVFALSNNDKSSYSYFNLKTNQIEKIHSFITDGNSYKVEFKVGENYSSYGFSHPESFARWYPSDHKLADFNSIVSILTSEVNNK